MIGIVIGLTLGLAGFAIGSGIEGSEKGKKWDNNMKKNLNEGSTFLGKNKPFLEDKSDRKYLK